MKLSPKDAARKLMDQYPSIPEEFDIDGDEVTAAEERGRQAERGTTWKCKANPTAIEPQDCDWPMCGCDPYADKVLAALDESGLSVVRAPTGDATSVRLDLTGDELTMLRDAVIRVHGMAGGAYVQPADEMLRRIYRLCEAAIQASPAMTGFLGRGGPEAHRDILSGGDLRASAGDAIEIAQEIREAFVRNIEPHLDNFGTYIFKSLVFLIVLAALLSPTQSYGFGSHAGGGNLVPFGNAYVLMVILFVFSAQFAFGVVFYFIIGPRYLRKSGR